MKLQDLGARRLTEQVAKVMQIQHGSRIDFDRLTETQAKDMLSRVRNLIKEHKDSVSFHYSERNPNYMKLVMMEQGLMGRLSEQPTTGTSMPGNTSTTGPISQPVNPAQMGMQIAQRKKQLQDQLRDAQEQVRNIQKQLSQPSLGMAESRLKLRESELQQAQVVMAAQDMVDQIQGMMEDISEMQFKDLPALVASIKNDTGPEQAAKFQADASAALTTLLAAVQTGKTQLETAQGVLTGQQPVMPAGGDTGDELGIEPVSDLDTDLENDLSIDANLPDEDEDEIGSLDSLGRERR